MGKNPRYTVNRDGTYHFVRAVPGDVQAVIGKTQWRSSLETGNRKEAEQKVRKHLDRTDAEIAAARAAENRKRRLSEIAAELDELGYSSPPDGWDTEALAWVSRFHKQHLLGRYEDASARLAPLPGVSVEPVLAAVWKGLEDEQRRIDAIHEEVTTPSKRKPQEPLVRDRLEDMFQLWVNDKHPAQRTQDEARVAMRYFLELNGDLPVKEYTRNHIRAFRDALLLKPKHISGSDRDLSFPTLIEKYRDQDVERVSRVSAKKLFSFVRSLFNTAINLHDLNESPTAGITISAPVSETDREPFSEDELRTMFSAAPFSPLNKSDDYWFILLSLFSGTRASELVQLRPEDLQEEGGIPFLDVSTSGGRTLKTKSSRRRLPIHPLLIHLGFVDWAKNRKGRIFNGIPVGKAQISDPASKRFNRWLDDIGISRPEVSLHSFRHTFKTMCRAANLDEHVSDVLSGHAPTSVARRYGKMPLEVLAEAMNRITCPVNIP